MRGQEIHVPHIHATTLRRRRVRSANPHLHRKQMADTYLSSVFVFVSHLHPLFVLIKTSQTVVYSKIVAIFIMNLYPRATFTPNFGESHNTLINITISLWLISLVFGIKSALIALQLQEWERAYIDTPNVPSRLHHRVLIPLRLFLGVDVYNMPNIAQFISALHISMCAFFGGHAVFFHTLDTNVAIVVDVGVAFAIFFLLSTIP